MGRDVLGRNFFYSGKSVLVGARWISKEEVCRLTERDFLSAAFGSLQQDIIWKILQKIAQIYNILRFDDVSKFCSVSIIAG